MWEYNKKVKDHFLNPRNMGKMDKPDAVGDAGSISCGDALTLMLKIDDNEKIIDAKFQTFGCASAIASSSALTELIIGKTIKEVENITNEEISGYLGGLPREKMHCSVMGHEALEDAIRNYRGEPEKIIEGNIVCECFNITDIAIEKAVREKNLSSIEDVTSYMKAGCGCGNCHEAIQEIIDKNLGIVKPAEKPKQMSNLEKIRLIEKTLDDIIRPALKKDRGDIELIDVDGDIVKVKMTGACASCKSAQMTLNNFVQTKLREHVLPELIIKEVR